MEPAPSEGKVKVVPVGCRLERRRRLARAARGAGRPGPTRSCRSVESVDLGSQDVLVHSSGGRLVVTVGLRDMIVVDTPDVVLVCAADRAQEVRTIVDRLAAAKETDHL